MTISPMPKKCWPRPNRRTPIGRELRFHARRFPGRASLYRAAETRISRGPRHGAARSVRAMREVSNAIADWTRIALALTHPGGTTTAILRSDRAEEMLAAGDEVAAVLFPLFPRTGEAPKRIIVQFLKGSREPRHVAAGL